MRYNRSVKVTLLAALVAVAGGCNFRIDPLVADGNGGVGGSGGASDDGGMPPIGVGDLGPTAGGDDLAHAGPFLELAALPTPATVDLTAEGTIDWAHWGYSSASDFDHKAMGNGQISNFQQVGINAPTPARGRGERKRGVEGK
jgi:hypothetical protein